MSLAGAFASSTEGQLNMLNSQLKLEQKQIDWEDEYMERAQQRANHQDSSNEWREAQEEDQWEKQ